MRVGLQTWGTDGDFIPFLALAIGLRSAGHEVMLAYTSVDGKDYSNRSDIGGIELIRANGNVEVSENFNPYAINAKPGSFKEYTTLLNRWFEPFTKAMFEASCKLCQQCDLVIGHPVCHTLVTASQKFQIPRISLVLTPLIVRSDHVSPIGVPLGKWVNSFLWSAGGSVATASWFKQGKAIRKREGLSPIKSLQQEVFTSDVLTLLAASESLAPAQPDWSENTRVTGFLNLPKSANPWSIPDDLNAFLAAGEPPVYFTFGSCTQFNLINSTQLMIEGAKRSGMRV
jgi:UDP:flavonoid glycosyltransferase YjiC (YdhE family)